MLKQIESSDFELVLIKTCLAWLVIDIYRVKEKDVDTSEEEIDEGLQEVAARPTRWYQRCSSRQQHHALECCYFRVNIDSFWLQKRSMSFTLLTMPFCLWVCRPDDTPWDGGKGFVNCNHLS